MRQLTVRDYEAGIRLDNYLNRYLKEASRGFLYKMLRKKNITLNGGKADGTEKLAAGDEIRLFLSEETMEKFGGGSLSEESAFESERNRPVANKSSSRGEGKGARRSLPVLYEDTDVIFFNKPAGMLSQKARPEDISVCEVLTEYLLEKGALTPEGLRTFRPGVCNRLDRNTSGVIAAGKTARGLRELSALLRERELKKLYLCLVWGKVERPERIRGYLVKDDARNVVTISRTPPGDRIETSYRPLAYGRGVTLLEVHLITGKTHQIRSHLASEGYPILGDAKYGDPQKNHAFAAEYALRVQLLHAWKMIFPAECPALPNLSGRCVQAPLPRSFRRCMEILDIPQMIL